MKTKHIVFLSAILSTGLGYLLYRKYNNGHADKVTDQNEFDDEQDNHRIKKNRHNGALAKHLYHANA